VTWSDWAARISQSRKKTVAAAGTGGVGCGGDDGADGAQPGAEGSIANLPARRPAKALLITNSRRRLQISAAEAPTGILYMLRIAGLYDLVV